MGASSYSIVRSARTLAAKHAGDVSAPALYGGESCVIDMTDMHVMRIKW